MTNSCSLTCELPQSCSLEKDRIDVPLVSLLLVLAVLGHTYVHLSNHMVKLKSRIQDSKFRAIWIRKRFGEREKTMP